VDFLNLSGGQYPDTYFLLNYQDVNSTPALYVNTTGVNFTTSPRYFVGDVFTDAAGHSWNITKLDTTDSQAGRVHLQSMDGVVARRDKWDTQTLLIEINISLSKSGIFLKGQNEWDGEVQDDEWMGVDLNGDGDYEDRYLVLMADTQTAGEYNAVYISNTSNFTADGIEVLPGQAISFGTDMPVYLTSSRYYSSTSGGTNWYELFFTSNRPAWWSGIDLGTFKPGSTVRVPVMITEPGNRSKFLNATVRVDSLISFDFGGPFGGINEVPITPVYNDTNWSGQPGVLILEINTTGVQSGEYKIPLKVKNLDDPTADWVGLDDLWEYPGVQLRTFVVNGQIGQRGRITGLTEWSVNEGNLKVNRSERVIKEGFVELEPAGPDMWHVWDWEFRDVWYNASNDSIYIDNTPDDWNFSDNYTAVDYHTELVKGMNVTRVVTAPENFTISLTNGSGSRVYIYHNFTVTNAAPGSPGNATITIVNLKDYYTEVQDEVTSEDSEIGGTGFRLGEVTPTNVTIEWNRPVMEGHAPYDIETEGEAIMRKLELGGGLSMLVYNSPEVQTAEDIHGWYGSMDRVSIVNETTGAVIKNYSFGQPIAEAGNFSVVQARPWDDRIFLSNLSINGSMIYPLPWVADDYYTFYVANFTESSIKAPLNWYRYDTTNQLDNTTQYYMLLFDSFWDGAKEITTAITDDDPVLDSEWVSAPYDFNGSELGNPDGTYNFDEHWTEIGAPWGDPQIVNINLSAGEVNTFKEQWDTKPDRNQTLWVSAKDINGVPINGNVTITKVTRMYWGPSGPVEETVNMTGSAPVTDGIGYLDLDFTGAGWGGYTFKFTVTDQVTGETETLKRSIFVDESGGGEPLPPAPGGGGE